MQYKSLFFLASFALITACSSNKISEKHNATDKELYQSAEESLKSENYESAAKDLELLEARYPFGQYAQQAQLKLIYAYYKSNSPAEALAAADRFIRLNPNHRYLDYAYYMKGLINFNADQSAVQAVLNTDFSKRDAGASRQAFKDFSMLVQKFPDSQYANDAKQRMIYLKNKLAEYEINVARYYMERGAYLAAANRCKYVVEHFPKTPAVKHALILMVQAYDTLGLEELKEHALRTLKLNYPAEAHQLAR